MQWKRKEGNREVGIPFLFMFSYSSLERNWKSLNKKIPTSIMYVHTCTYTHIYNSVKEKEPSLKIYES